MKMQKENEFIEVFAGTPIDAGLVRSLLENADIITFLKDENMASIAPWYVSAGGVGAVKINVSGKDYDVARAIVEEYEKTLK